MASNLEKLRFGLFRRVLIPSGKPVGETIGAGIGVVGDLGNFITETLKAPYLLTLFGAATILFAALCLKKASVSDTAEPGEAGDFTACRECQGLRISFYATIAFGILMLIGQGESASERIGTSLGLIQRDVADIRKAMESNILIDDPVEAEEFYHNAYLQLRSSNEPKAAAASLDEMYKRHSPNKMDAAELYWETHMAQVSASELVSRMVELGRSKRDAHLIVVAARHESNGEARQKLMAEARTIDPQNPFGYWDWWIANQEVIEGGDMQKLLQVYRRQLTGMDAALPLLESKPVGHFYFRPQHAANPLETLRTQRPMVEQNVKSYERIARGGKFFDGR